MQKTYKLLIILCSGLICFALLAKQPAPDQRPKRSKPVQKERHQRTQRPPQAIGVILTFHKWPSKKEQRQISEILNQDSLTLSKKFKSFKALVFSWPKLKTKNKAQKVCRKLSQLKNLNYCEPDALLRPNAPADSETEAGSCAADCGSESELSDILQELSNIGGVSKKSCELFSTQYQLDNHSSISDYWALEMVGADLLREELEKAPPLPEDKLLIALFDVPIEKHYEYMSSIISHEGPQAVTPPLGDHIEYFDSEYPSYVMQTIRDLSSEGRQPSFITSALSWSNGQTTYDIMSKITPPSVVVISAGNKRHLRSINKTKTQFSKDFDGILVGSLAPDGTVTTYSQDDEEVHILAPGDQFMVSFDSEGNYEPFGGTSGAVALTAGSLAGFEWLSGYHPTPAEAKILLENTATPTLYSAFHNPRKNGVGMLNAYKLGMTAKKLKSKCGDNADCFKTEIQNPENYTFSLEENILEEVQRAFPECSGQKIQGKCDDKKQALKKLRKAVLLDAGNVELSKQLYCIYKQEDFSDSAFAVEANLAAATKNLDHLNSEHMGNLLYYERQYSRLFSQIDKDTKLNFFNQLLDRGDLDRSAKRYLFKALVSIGGAEVLAPLERMLDDPDFQTIAGNRITVPSELLRRIINLDESERAIALESLNSIINP